MKTLQTAQQATSHIFAALADMNNNGVVATDNGDMIIAGEGLGAFMKANYEDTSGVYLDVRIIDFLCDRPVEIEYFVVTTHKGLPYIFPVSLDKLSDLSTVIEIFDGPSLSTPKIFSKHPLIAKLDGQDVECEQLESNFINEFFGVDEDVEQEMNDAAIEALEALSEDDCDIDDFEEPRSECDAWEEKCDNEDCAHDSFGRGH